MRAALAGWIACAGGAAPGRDIPVYREYTLPISFYDEQGERAVSAALAPDRVENQSVWDAQARKAMMGKETLLELDFRRGSAVFGAQASLSGKMAPAVGRGDDDRRQKDDSGRNWLVKSLSLPSLGQMPSNTAVSAMSMDGNESGWGWLVDDVMDASGQNESRPEDLLPEAEESNPFLRERAATPEQTESESAGSFPKDAADETGQDRNSPNRNAISGEESVRRDLPGQARADFVAPQSYRAPASTVAEMSQTRQMIAELTAGSRPDFASLRESLVGATAGKSDQEGAIQSERPGLDLPSGAGSSPGTAAWGRPPSSIGYTKLSGAGTSWKGGWNLPGAGGSIMPQVETPAPTLIPESKPENSRPGLSGGGYKPAWD